MSDLLAYVQAEQRVCPKQEQWRQLWEMLPGRIMAGAGCYPEPGLIYQHWLSTSDEEKRQRLAYHIRFAEEHGALEKVEVYLRGLKAKDWLYEGELTLLQANTAAQGRSTSRHQQSSGV